MEFSSLPTDGGDDSAWGSKLLTSLNELRDGVNAATGSLMVNVVDYGATLGGVTDDSAAWASAMSAVAVGGTIRIPYGTLLNAAATPLQVTKRVNIDGYGATIKVTSGNVAGLNLAPDAHLCTVRGLSLQGPGSTSYAGNSHGINASGASGSAPLKRLWLRDVTFTGWGAAAVRAQYVERFKFIDCDVDGTAYAGFVFLSAKKCEVRGGTIENVLRPTAPTDAAYGVAFTRGNGDEATDPRSEDCKATGVTLHNVNWEALDTHGGKRITFAGNTVTGSRRAIALVAAPIGSTDTFAPVDCSVTGNVVDSLVTDGSAGAGVLMAGAFDGASVVEYASGAIASNTVRGYGGADGDTTGGISWYYSRGVAVTGNTVIEASGGGAFVAYRDNIGFNCTGNTAIDPWSATYGGVAAYHVRSLNNTGNISGNNHFAGTKTATNLNLFGIRFSSLTGVDVTVGVNNLAAAATKVYQGATVAKFSVLDKAPVVKPVSPGTASGTDAAVINAVVAALRSQGLVT